MPKLDIPVKKRGDTIPHEEYNAIVAAVNASAGFCKLKTEEYFKLLSVDDSTTYLCLGADGQVDYMYIGSVLVARRDKGSGPNGFPYDFPIVF